MTSEAQMIMALSMRKIVESRNRRGGASLHRNLLVAGVLFRARDVLLATETAAEKPSPSDDSAAANPDVDRKLGDDEDMNCERTAAEVTSSSSPADIRSRSVGKENVPPSSRLAPAVTSDHEVEPSTDKSRAVKRQPCDADDDDVVPHKTSRVADTFSAERRDSHEITEPATDDVADNEDDEVRRQTRPSITVSLPPPSTIVARRSSAVSCLPCFTVPAHGRLTHSVADPVVIVRPLLVVQVV